MDEPGRHVEEAALLDLRAVAAAGTEIEARATANDVTEYVALAVVMPAGGGIRLGAGTHQRCAVDVERDLADDAGCRRGDLQVGSGDCGDALLLLLRHGVPPARLELAHAV